VVEILGLIRRLTTERRIALLLASHLLDQVQATCDRIGIFYAGRLIGEGSIAQLGLRFGGSRARLAVAFEDGGRDRFDRAAAERLLRTVPGVATLDLADPTDPELGLGDPLPLGTVGWVVGLAEDASTAAVRHELVRRVGEAGLPLAELRLLVPSLGEIYRRAVEGEDDAEAAGQVSVA